MNRITELFKIQYPIIQGGMVWCSGWRLALAVSENGGLGLLGAGSMHPDILREHIRKIKKHSSKPFGVNVPLLYPEIETLMHIIVEEGVKVVFTSAGNPKTWTSFLKAKGITVVHVVSNSKFAIKAEEAGVDAIVVEGFEAGGHNGREETTSMVAIPQVRKSTHLPLIAAGGISSGEAMLSAMVLGADGVQIGTRFIASEESSAHQDFKQSIIDAKEGDTMLSLKKLVPARLLKNDFFKQVNQAEQEGKDKAYLSALLGRGRAKKGMFEGDLKEGELEAGQVSSLINSIEPVQTIIQNIIQEYQEAKSQIPQGKYLIL